MLVQLNKLLEKIPKVHDWRENNWGETNVPYKQYLAIIE